MGYTSNVSGTIQIGFFPKTEICQKHSLRVASDLIIPTGNEKNLEVKSDLQFFVDALGLKNPEGKITVIGEHPGDHHEYTIVNGIVVEKTVMPEKKYTIAEIVNAINARGWWGQNCCLAAGTTPNGVLTLCADNHEYVEIPGLN